MLNPLVCVEPSILIRVFEIKAGCFIGHQAPQILRGYVNLQEYPTRASLQCLMLKLSCFYQTQVSHLIQEGLVQL